ncbi:annexin A1-like isoform X2 [Antennarius striatus]|uniref:annexin A1-like isoform X2 n=1 Tax=Antennarius striatus TaxID=241820 RepID=UPI0035B08E83
MAFFKKLIRNIKNRDDDDDDDDTVTVRGVKKPKYYGTVVPYPDFNASSDASVLEDAIKTKGVDEDVIISVLAKRSNDQRQKIKVVYETSAGEKLGEALKSSLRSDLEDVSLALLMTPAMFDAHLLRKATKHWGTNEKVLVEVLATRTNEQIEEIKRVFKEEYNVELEEVIKDETSGDFTKALLAMLEAKRSVSTDVNMDLAVKDAEALFEAGENHSGTDVSAFIDILTTRSGPQLSKTFQHYKIISDNSLPVALGLELKGDIEDCLVDTVKACWNTPAFFAERLHEAMKGHGTCEETLIRILVSRSEVDLKKILVQYRLMYDVSLQDDIVRDTEGHYRDILLALCGPI